MRSTLPLLFLIFILIHSINGQEWKNIIPLKSTKADVEKMFGQPTEKDKYGVNGFYYAVPDGTITVFYAPERCKGEIRGWDVVPDTVLTFTFYQDYPEDKRFADYSKIAKENLITITTDTMVSYFIDPQKGLTYVFSIERTLARLELTPKVSDNRLRCKGFPDYNAAGASFIPYIHFYETDFATAKSRIDSLFIEIPQNLNVYLVIYSRNNFSGKEFYRYLQQVRKYIKTRNKVDSKRTFVIDGGRKEQFEVSVFGLPKSYPPPMPKPDF